MLMYANEQFAVLNDHVILVKETNVQAIYGNTQSEIFGMEQLLAEWMKQESW